MIMPEDCKKCFANTTAQQLRELDFERKKVIKETKDKIIKLFKEDKIYTGAVIKLEINMRI